jgi:fatty-acyl-CoA synthase
MAEPHAVGAELYRTCTVGEMFLRALQRSPQALAVQYDAKTLTYEELTAEVGRAVSAFRSAGLRPGDGIAILAPNRPELVTVIIAAQVLGLRCTPLHPLGSEADHAYVLQDAEIACLIVDAGSFADRGRALSAAVRLPKGTLTLGPAAFGADLLAAMAAGVPAPLKVEANPAGIPYLLYTGGSTGRPKGVIHSHRSYVFNTLVAMAEREWARELRFLVATPLSHVAGMLLAAPMLRGGSIHLLPRFTPEAYLTCVQEQRITQTFVAPTMIYALLDSPRLREFDVSSLEIINYGSAPISPARLAHGIEVFGPIFTQVYGQTEALATLTRLLARELDPAHPERMESCGRPNGAIELRLLDEALAEVPPGEVGEICLRGPMVMEGYWKRPEETAAALRGGWLHTGDLAREDSDGFLYIVDRLKDMIVSGGFNVYPREVEDALTAHPSVAAAAVIGVPDAHWGEAVKAVVVLKNGSGTSAEELIAHVRERKGPVCAPKSVDFVAELPLTAVGKADKKRLRAQYWPQAGRQVG